MRAFNTDLKRCLTGLTKKSTPRSSLKLCTIQMHDIDAREIYTNTEPVKLEISKIIK